MKEFEVTHDQTYAISLSKSETTYLSDALSMFGQGPPNELFGSGSPYPYLILKIGAAFIRGIKEESKLKPVTVHLTPAELWVVREVAKSSVVVGSEKVGYNLMEKIYPPLLDALQRETDISFGEEMGLNIDPGFLKQLNEIVGREDSDDEVSYA